MIGGGQVAVAQRLGHPAVTRTNGDFATAKKSKRHLRVAKASKLTTTTVKSAKSSKLCAKSSKSTKGGAHFKSSKSTKGGADEVSILLYVHKECNMSL